MWNCSNKSHYSECYQEVIVIGNLFLPAMVKLWQTSVPIRITRKAKVQTTSGEGFGELLRQSGLEHPTSSRELNCKRWGNILQFFLGVFTDSWYRVRGWDSGQRALAKTKETCRISSRFKWLKRQQLLFCLPVQSVLRRTKMWEKRKL